MELKVEEIKSLAPIQFNYEDIKKWVTEKAKEYKSVIYTQETITTAKSDRATLNKVAKAINDEKIRIKKEVLKPFEDFENKCKELQSIITDASNSIDTQVKAFEEKEQNEKKEQIKAVFDAYVGDYKELINFDTIFNPRWLNKTYTMKKIEDEINHLIVKTNDDLKVIDSQITNESINQAVKNYYFKNIADSSVLGNALQEGMRLDESNKKLEELKKAQEERKQPEVVANKTEVIPGEQNNKIVTVKFEVTTTIEKLHLLHDFVVKNDIEIKKI